ncbi:MAG: DUF58 domain-containing protein [Fulvimarina manganoxydans]|uniref:DUF58 domain-containing protein n=1 Tax=Fulvimarina manganoxydans TaxID=937218 RepID=UPI00235500D5|nr:DUF58 domain-containing protein [Fulvimarina manganoxydans]MCK5931746.1 DUF58 domain-containing protein [Fulvimarina manganoxydans]
MGMPFAGKGEGGPTEVSAETLFGLRHVVRNSPERGLSPVGRPGGFAGRRRGNGLEIVDVRLFSEGDDARHIDAAATARTAKTHVRTFREERDRAALLVADFRLPMLWGTRGRLRSVAAAGALALAGWRVVEGGGRVGLMVLTGGEEQYIPPKPRERGMATVCEALQRAHEAAVGEAEGRRDQATGDLSTLLEGAIARSSRGTRIVLATALDGADETFDRLAAAAGRRFDLEILLMIDPFEKAAPRGAYPFLPMGENRKSALGWAFLTGERRMRDDQRIERLRAAGVTIRMLASDANWSLMAGALEGFDDPRS